MTAVLKIRDRTITTEEIVPLLTQYQLLPQFLREVILDEAIASLEFTPYEQEAALERFYAQQQVSPTERQAWLKRQHLTQEDVQRLAERATRIERFKYETWGNQLESHFLKRKASLDRVVYSLLRTKEQGLAQELYFRIQEGEQSFAEVAKQYSQGPEAQTQGIIGPVELNKPHPAIAKLLSIGQPGQLWPPIQIDEWFLIIRLERSLPAQLDDTMKQRLLQELFNEWLQNQINQVMPAVLNQQQEQPSE
jgi:parvulin-like peptidyl-prolyl isomerase